MPSLDKKTIANLTQLSRIECSAEEQEKLLKDFQSILAYIELLQEVDTSQTHPCDHLLEGIVNVMREDNIGTILPRDVFLSNVPQHSGGYVKIPPVLKQA